MSANVTLSPKTQFDSRGRRLESWKEIAAYLGRDVTTVRRWEKREGLPVYRLQHSKLGSVYAYTAELDAWRDKRALAGATDTPEAEADHQPSRTRRVHRWLLLGGVAVVGLLAAAYVITRSRAADAARPRIKSLAVLPLRNLSGDPAQEYLADRMTEALIGRLSDIHDLRVISCTSVMRFKDTRLSVSEIAKTLAVFFFHAEDGIRDGSRI